MIISLSNCPLLHTLTSFIVCNQIHWVTGIAFGTPTFYVFHLRKFNWINSYYSFLGRKSKLIFPNYFLNNLLCDKVENIGNILNICNFNFVSCSILIYNDELLVCVWGANEVAVLSCRPAMLMKLKLPAEVSVDGLDCPGLQGQHWEKSLHRLGYQPDWLPREIH